VGLTQSRKTSDGLGFGQNKIAKPRWFCLMGVFEINSGEFVEVFGARS